MENFLTDLNKENFASGKKSLAMVIKKFWFHKNYNSTKTFDNTKQTSYFLALSIDFYILADNLYTPFVRKDTLIEIPIKFFQPFERSING